LRLANYQKTICVLATLLVLCASFVGVHNTQDIAFAESSNYSNVLDDLKKDSSFLESNYPSKANDYSLQIIQLAESVNKELFVYVYQPNGDKAIQASSINISTTINDSISFYNYKLEFLNSKGVFYKYKVKDFAVKSDNVRYYAISSIYRPWTKGVDAETGNSNTITEVNYNVSKQYCFGTINGNPYCNVVDIETIVVTDKFVGFVRYPDGFKLYTGACDSHFVAFNTDKPMDKLLEADVYYSSQSYGWAFVPLAGTSEEFGEKKDNYAYLKYTDKVTHSGGGLFAGTYSWDRIQTVDDFIAAENREQIYHGAILNVKASSKLTDDALNQLKGKAWVLRFAETNYSLYTGQGSTTSFSTLVGDVTILRLKFETDGIVYNLGVIDNKQTGGTEPVNETDIEVELNNNGKMLLSLLFLILLIILMWPFIPFILDAIKWFISAPFKLIISICKNRKSKGGGNDGSSKSK